MFRCAFAASLINGDLAQHTLNDCIVHASPCVRLRQQPRRLCDSELLGCILQLFTPADWILAAVGGLGSFPALFSREAGCEVKSPSSA